MNKKFKTLLIVTILSLSISSYSIAQKNPVKNIKEPKKTENSDTTITNQIIRTDSLLKAMRAWCAEADSLHKRNTEWLERADDLRTELNNLYYYPQNQR